MAVENTVLQLHRMVLQILLNRKRNGKGKKKSLKHVFQSKVYHGSNPLRLCFELVGKTLKAAKDVFKIFMTFDNLVFFENLLKKLKFMQHGWSYGTGDLLSLCSISRQMEPVAYWAYAAWGGMWNRRPTELMQHEWTDGTGDLLSLCSKSGQMKPATYWAYAALVDIWNRRTTELMQHEWTDGTGDLLSLCSMNGQMEPAAYWSYAA